jgi:hypothetical protein
LEEHEESERISINIRRPAEIEEGEEHSELEGNGRSGCVGEPGFHSRSHRRFEALAATCGFGFG